MKPIPLTRRHHLQHFTTTLDTYGISSERILGRLNMPMWQYGDPNDLIPLTHVLSVLREASWAAGNERFGLLVGERNYFNKFTTLGALISGSLTVYHAMQTTCKLANAHTSLAKLWLMEAGDTIRFCRSQLAGMGMGLRQHEQYIVAVMIGIVRLGAGPEWKPPEIWLCTPHQPRLEETEALSDIRIRYGQPHGAIAVPRSIACRPILRNVTPDPLLDDSMERRFLSPTPADSFVGSLRQVIGALLSEGQPTIKTAAEIVGIKVRTLQKQLQCEKITFKTLIDEARFDAATRLLERTDASVTNIAFDVGYADVAHFTRAFRRWAAVPPREYRHLTLANGNAVEPQAAVSGVEEARSTAGIAPTAQT